MIPPVSEVFGGQPGPPGLADKEVWLWLASGIGRRKGRGQPQPVAKQFSNVVDLSVQMVPSLPRPATPIMGVNTPFNTPWKP